MKRTLNRARILKAALKIVEKDGLDGLTMRRLADRLGVGTMSLYNHIPGKEDLLDGIVEQMLRDVEIPSGRGRGPEARLRGVAHSLRDAAHRHPEVFRIIALRPPPRPLLSALDLEIENLRELGFTRPKAAQALRVLLGYVFGYVRLETGGFFPSLETVGDRTDAEEFPEVVGLSPYLTDWNPDREFDSGLDALLKGLSNRDRGRARTTAASN